MSITDLIKCLVGLLPHRKDSEVMFMIWQGARSIHGKEYRIRNIEETYKGRAMCICYLEEVKFNHLNEEFTLVEDLKQ